MTSPRDDAAQHAAAVRDRNKVLSGDQLDQILHARVDRDRTVMDAARDLGEQHVSGLFGRVPEQQAQKIALGDRADVAPLGAQDRNGGKTALKHPVERRSDRIGVVNINYFSLRLEKKRYVHMRYLSAARSRPLYYPARIGRPILS